MNEMLAPREEARGLPRRNARLYVYIPAYFSVLSFFYLYFDWRSSIFFGRLSNVLAKIAHSSTQLLSEHRLHG